MDEKSRDTTHGLFFFFVFFCLSCLFTFDSIRGESSISIIIATVQSYYSKNY